MFFKKIKLKREIRKHDKNYIKQKDIIGIDETTKLYIYNYKILEKFSKKC